MGLAVGLADRDLGVLHHLGWIEQPHLEARLEQPLQVHVHFLLADQVLLHRLQIRGNIRRHGAVVVGPLLQRKSRRLGQRFEEAVALVNVRDGAAVGHHVAVELPGAAQRVLQQKGVDTGRLAIDAVVGAHHRTRFALHDRGAERRQVRVFHVVPGGLHVDRVAGGLRTAVHRVVLGRGDGSIVLGIAALHAGDEGHAHAGGQEGIFAVGLLPAAPPGIAEDVDVRRPEVESEPAAKSGRRAAGRFPLPFVEPGPGLHTDHGCHFIDQRRIPGGAKANHLGKHRHVRGSDPVQCLAPPGVRRNLQPRDGCRPVHQLAGFLVHRHPGHQVVHTLVERKGGIQVRRLRDSAGLLAQGGGHSGQQHEGDGERRGQSDEHLFVSHAALRRHSINARWQAALHQFGARTVRIGQGEPPPGVGSHYPSTPQGIESSLSVSKRVSRRVRRSCECDGGIMIVPTRLRGKKLASLVVAAGTLVLLALAPVSAPAPPQPPTGPWMDKALSPDRRADLVVEQMTLDEKITLVHGTGGFAQSGARSNGGAGVIEGIPRLGLPDLQLADSAVGVRAAAERGRYATLLPSTVAEAATWDVKLAFAYGDLIGRELRDQQYNVSLGGGVNITREPRNGRNFEYLGEDPILAGKMLAQWVKGLQSNHVIGDVKHYALNDQETGRNIGNVRLDKRTARQTDLLAFEIAVIEGQPGMAMCSYNKFNGDWACENSYLLTDVLKNAWGFKGFVMSDWGGTHSTVKAALAGMDNEEPGSRFFGDALKKAVESGEVPTARLNDMVHRI